MAINVTCLCGRLQSVPKTMAGQTLTCAGCGQPLAIPSLDVLRKIKAKNRAAAGNGNFAPVGPEGAGSAGASPSHPGLGDGTGLVPAGALPSRRGGKRLLAIAVISVLLLGGAVGGVGWWAGHRTRAEAEPLAQAEPPRQNSDAAPEKPYRQPPSEATTAEPGRVPAPAQPIVTPSEPAPAPPVKLIPSASPTTPTEPVKPPVVPERPKEKVPPVGEVKAPPLAPGLAQLVWKLKEGETFYQEVIVTQKPAFSIQGLPVQLLLQYRVVSRFTVEKSNEDGTRVARQKIEAANLLQADDLTRGAVAPLIAKLPGTSFTVELSPKMEVTKFAGEDQKPAVMALAGGQGMQLASLLDRDGWKELAQMTFFQMDQPAKVKGRWSKPLTHNWGALGSWAGKVHYEYLGQQGDIHKVAYALELKYKAPAADAVLAGMPIASANFQPQQAVGLLSFDAARGKVVVAEERFRVKGVLNAKLLGQLTPIEMEDDQHFLIRIHEKKPE